MIKLNCDSDFFIENKIKESFPHLNNGPILIEISGTPNSGKTSALNSFDTLLRRNSINNVKIIFESAQKCPIKNKFSDRFNIWTLNATLNSIIESVDQSYDYIICERGLFDALCWMNLYNKEGLLTKKQFHSLLGYLRNFEWASIFRYVFIAECSIEAAISREENIDFIKKVGSIVNPVVLEKYNNAIKTTIHQLSSNHIHYTKLDTTSLCQKKSSMAIISSIAKFISMLSDN